MISPLRHGLLAALFVLAACTRSTGDAALNDPALDAVLTFQTNAEVLRLPRLQTGRDVYENVSLQLAANGSWKLSSVGQRRPLLASERPDARLDTNDTSALGSNWRPEAATISIARLHIDDKVMGNVVVQLTGAQWRFTEGMSEIKALSMADFQVNPRLAATDSHHVALRSHPTVPVQKVPLKLQTQSYNFCFDAHDGPGDTYSLADSAGTVVFTARAGQPCVKVQAKEGTYTFTHTYGNGGKSAMLFLRPQPLRPGVVGVVVEGAVNRMAGFKRNILDAESRRRVKGTAEGGYPEFWSIYADDYIGTSLQGLGGYLSANVFSQVATGVFEEGNSCDKYTDAYIYSDPLNAFRRLVLKQLCPEVVEKNRKLYESGESCDFIIDRAGSFDGRFTRPGETYGSEFPLWNDKNFFLITRDANGRPSTIGTTAGCFKVNRTSARYCFHFLSRKFGSGSYFCSLDFFYTGIGEYLDPPSDTYAQVDLKVDSFSSSTFRIIRTGNYGSGGTRAGLFRFDSVPIWFNTGTFQGDAGPTVPISNVSISFPGLSDGEYITSYAGTDTTRRFQVHYRYFPFGAPPESQNPDGTPLLDPGEVALFPSQNCTGPFITLMGDRRRTPNFGIRDFKPQSMMLGNRASAYVKRMPAADIGDATNSRLINQGGCITGLDGSNPSASQIPWPVAEVEVAVADVTMVVSYRNCDNCDLRGLQLQNGVDLTDVSLRGANLSGASFAGSNLSRAQLTYATMQGINLDNANLDQANLCMATLSSSPQRKTSAAGAFMRNVNLYGTVLDNADLSGVYLYSSTRDGNPTPNDVACTDGLNPNSAAMDCSGVFKGSCTNAKQASFINTSLANSYLSKANLSSTKMQRANMAGATLIGASLNGANLQDASLVGANLQGVDFSGATLDNVDLSNAYLDNVASQQTCVMALLTRRNLSFPGYPLPTGDFTATGSPVCGPTPPNTPPPSEVCIQLSYGTQSSATPSATASPLNTPLPTSAKCPDGSQSSGTAPYCAIWSRPGSGPASLVTSACDPNSPVPACGQVAADPCW